MANEWASDAGVFIAALLLGDLRHAEARALVEVARRGEHLACATSGILSEVYAALTWQQAQPPHTPEEAARAVRLLIEPPSAIRAAASLTVRVIRASLTTSPSLFLAAQLK